jgi:hypothetical protein
MGSFLDGEEAESTLASPLAGFSAPDLKAAAIHICLRFFRHADFRRNHLVDRGEVRQPG